jgi:hypothetical protein
MLARQEYESAQEALEALLRSGSLDAEELVEVYRGLAECGAALRQPERARDAFIDLLALEPEFYIASQESPLILDPFEQAVAFWRDRQLPSLHLTPPEQARSDEPLVIRAELVRGDRPSLMAQVVLHLRLPNGGYEEIPAPEGRAEIGADRLAGATEVEFYLSAHDEHGNTVALVGAPAQPFQVALNETSRGARRWYQRWWVWTIVGAAVVGLAVGLSVGLTASDGGDPCVEALGAPCDFQLRPEM